MAQNEITLAERADASVTKASAAAAATLQELPVKESINSVAATRLVNTSLGVNHLLSDRLAAKLDRRRSAGLPYHVKAYYNSREATALQAQHGATLINAVESWSAGAWPNSTPAMSTGITLLPNGGNNRINRPFTRLLAPIMPTPSRVAGTADLWWGGLLMWTLLLLGLALFSIPAALGLCAALGAVYILAAVVNRTYLTSEDFSEILHTATTAKLNLNNPEDEAFLTATASALASTFSTYAWNSGYLQQNNMDWAPLQRAREISKSVLLLTDLKNELSRPTPSSQEDQDAYLDLHYATRNQTLEFLTLTNLTRELSANLQDQESRSTRSPSHLARRAWTNAAQHGLSEKDDQDMEALISGHSNALRTL